MTIPDDVGKATPLGVFEVEESGLTTLSLTPLEDYKVEGSETLVISLVGSSIGGDQWEECKCININR